MARRSFGSIRELPSGRFQARRRRLRPNDPGIAATFDSRVQAEEWLQNTARVEDYVAQYAQRWGAGNV